MTPSPTPYLDTLSQVNNISTLLTAFGLSAEEALLRPMLEKPRGGAASFRPFPSDQPVRHGFVESSPRPQALTYLDKVLSNIRAILPEPLLEEIARHDRIKSRLEAVFQNGFLYKAAKRIAGCHQAYMVLRNLDSKAPALAHLIPYLCNQRACPACSRRRSWDLFTRVMEEVGPRILHQPDEYSLRWITFTMRSPKWGALAPGLDDLLHAWVRIRRHDHALWTDNVDGYLFNVEISCNRSSKTWHPHIHVVYTGDFIPQSLLDRAWRRRLAPRDREGHAQIGRCYVNRPGRSPRTPAENAWTAEDLIGCLREVTKYTLKPFESDQVPDSAILELHDALHNRRLTGAGGILATSPAPTTPIWANLNGLARMLDNRDSPFWTSPKFSGAVHDAAMRDTRRWLRLVQNYSHFWHLQNAQSHPDKGAPPSC